MDLLDDIFSQPTSQKIDCPLGKFQPKGKKKIEKSVPRPPTISSIVSQPSNGGGSNDHHSLQLSIADPGSSKTSLILDASVSFENSELWVEQEKSQNEVQTRISAEDSLENIFLESAILAGEQSKIFSLPSCHESSDGSEHVSLFINPVCPSHPVLAEEALNQLHSDASLPECGIDSEVAGVFSNENSFDDLVVQPTTTSVRALGKFRPKGIMQPKKKIPPKATSFIPVTESIEAPIVGLHNSGSIDRISEFQVSESEHHSNNITQQDHAIDIFSHKDSHFCPQNDEDTRIPSNHYISEPSSKFSVAEDPPCSNPGVEFMASCFSRDTVTDRGELDGENSCRKNISSAYLEEVDKVNFQNADLHSEVVHKEADHGAGEEGVANTRQLRKRTAVHAPVYDFEEENNEDSGPFNTQESDRDNNDDDSEYTGEKMPTKKKVFRKPKCLSDEKQPVRKHKKPSADVHPTKQEPAKKHFPHSTRRKRRQVDKVLLETPEDEIDERKLCIKDLILLAEARERMSIKEAAAATQSNANNSSSHVSNNHHFDEESMYTEEQDRSLDDDEYGANPEAKQSLTKFNYQSFMNKSRSSRWSKVDTELFYRAIRQFGTDFAMIQQLFPTRTRHQVKLKFKNEERKHPLQIADALIYRSKDVSQFEVVIQQLQAQALQNSSKDVMDEEEASEWQDAAVGNENGEVGKSEQEEDHGANELDRQEEQDANDLGQGPSDVKYDEYQDVFDFSELGNDDAPYVGKDEHYGI